MYEGKFEQWIQSKFGYSAKSSRDVKSRVKRAGLFVDINAKISDEEVIFKLSQHPEFKKLNPSVKSQLKRGVKIYREYLREVQKSHNIIE